MRHNTQNLMFRQLLSASDAAQTESLESSYFQIPDENERMYYWVHSTSIEPLGLFLPWGLAVKAAVNQSLNGKAYAVESFSSRHGLIGLAVRLVTKGGERQWLL